MQDDPGAFSPEGQLLSKRERFFQGAQRLRALACPVCGGLLSRREDGLACDRGHHWNVHKKGYVTFQQGGDQLRYSQSLFQARARVFSAGFFDPVVEMVLQRMPAGAQTLLDAGCGDGWYVGAIMQERPAMAVVGVDLSSAAIAMATNHPVPGVWCVGDLRRLPLADHTMDVLLDVLSPAAYDDFGRVMRREGLLLKVYPQENHLREIREAAGLPPYVPGQVEDHLLRHFLMDSRIHLRRTMEVTETLWADLVRMTPLSAGLPEDDMKKVTQAASAQVTLDVMLAVCRVPQP